MLEEILPDPKYRNISTIIVITFIKIVLIYFSCLESFRCVYLYFCPYLSGSIQKNAKITYHCMQECSQNISYPYGILLALEKAGRYHSIYDLYVTDI